MLTNVLVPSSFGTGICSAGCTSTDCATGSNARTTGTPRVDRRTRRCGTRRTAAAESVSARNPSVFHSCVTTLELTVPVSPVSVSRVHYLFNEIGSVRALGVFDLHRPARADFRLKERLHLEHGAKLFVRGAVFGGAHKARGRREENHRVCERLPRKQEVQHAVLNRPSIARALKQGV